MSTTVYVLEATYYDEREVLGIFANEEDAITEKLRLGHTQLVVYPRQLYTTSPTESVAFVRISIHPNLSRYGVYVDRPSQHDMTDSDFQWNTVHCETDESEGDPWYEVDADSVYTAIKCLEEAMGTKFTVEMKENIMQQATGRGTR